MAELVSKRYALALFEAGLDLGKINDFSKELDFLKGVFQGERKLFQILGHPKISKKEKKALIDELFKDRLSMEMVNFLYILIDKRRESYILDIVDQYKGLFNEHENIVEVVATTAVAMKDEDKTQLAKVLGDKLNKKVELTNEVDASIYGGVLLKVANKIIDGTLKGQLEGLSRAISGATN